MEFTSKVLCANRVVVEEVCMYASIWKKVSIQQYKA